MHRTRFPHRAKILQLERLVVFEIVDVGRIHRQVLLDVVGWLSLGDAEDPDKPLRDAVQEDSQLTRRSSEAV